MLLMHTTYISDTKQSGRIVACFHSDPGRSGRYIAYRPGRRGEALEWDNRQRGCGPTFATPEQVIAFLEENGR